jgi:hypothetical protein
MDADVNQKNGGPRPFPDSMLASLAPGYMVDGRCHEIGAFFDVFCLAASHCCVQWTSFTERTPTPHARR